MWPGEERSWANVTEVGRRRPKDRVLFLCPAQAPPGASIQEVGSGRWAGIGSWVALARLMGGPSTRDNSENSSV